MASALVRNHTVDLVPIPANYGGGEMSPGSYIIVADTVANVASAFGHPPSNYIEITSTPDGQHGAITPSASGAGGAQAYTPATANNWPPTAPTTLGAALDTLAKGKGLINRQVISATGTYTPTPGTNRAMVRLVGGGGGGGGVANSAAAQTAVGGGGASGDYVEAWIDPGNGNYPLVGGAATIGAAGTAGVNTGGAGGTGGNTSLVVGGVTLTAKGGTGGSFTGSSASAQICAGGASQGGSSAGDILVPAEPGVPGFTQSGTLGESGQGGNSFMGSGGASKIAQGAGNAGAGFGAGGSGALSINAGGAVAGGAGSAGLIVVYEYA